MYLELNLNTLYIAFSFPKVRDKDEVCEEYSLYEMSFSYTET